LLNYYLLFSLKKLHLVHQKFQKIPLNQKALNTASEWGRRENLLRNELRASQEELQRVQLKVANLEKRCISQDEEMRRIKSLNS